LTDSSSTGEFVQELGLVPQPVEVLPGATAPFRAQGRLDVYVSPALRQPMKWWSTTVEQVFDVDVWLHTANQTVGTGQTSAHVQVESVSDLPSEGYRLEVTENQILLQAGDERGVHGAVQTLRQLAGTNAYRQAPVGSATTLEIPALRITDYPRTAWRGVMLDVARHFMPKAGVMRFIEQAAAHKFNLVHLHLTDDQGWRVEIDQYPKLTEVSSWRKESIVGTWRDGELNGRPHGGFYTKDDLREIVAFAAQRGITVLPEIDIPGHVQSVVAAYPELGAATNPVEVRTTWGVSPHVLNPTDEAVAFFKNVFSEVLEVFPGPYIGLGGDEVPTVQWEERADIRQRAADLGLAKVSDLHGWFVAQIADHVVAQGRRPVVWDEAMSELLPKKAIVTSWRGYARGVWAAEAGHDAVMAPEQVLYLDHRASEDEEEPIPVGFSRTVTDVYAFDPLPGELAEQAAAAPGDLLGAQAQIWTEHLDNPRRVDYATYPRLAAFAEAAWSPVLDRSPGSAASADFMTRLRERHLPRLAAAGIEYRPLDGPLPWQKRPGVNGFPRDLEEEMAAGGLVGIGGWQEGSETA